MDKLNEEAMQIILYAGDARVLITEAIKKLESRDFDGFESGLNNANEKLISAHRIQTKGIQDQMEFVENQYSILFSHAQDTLMTVKSEYEITKNFGGLFIQLLKEKK